MNILNTDGHGVPSFLSETLTTIDIGPDGSVYPVSAKKMSLFGHDDGGLEVQRYIPQNRGHYQQLTPSLTFTPTVEQQAQPLLIPEPKLEEPNERLKEGESALSKDSSGTQTVNLINVTELLEQMNNQNTASDDPDGASQGTLKVVTYILNFYGSQPVTSNPREAS